MQSKFKSHIQMDPETKGSVSEPSVAKSRILQVWAKGMARG